MISKNLKRDIEIIFRSEIQKSSIRDISSNEELDTAKLLYNLYNKNKNSEKKFKKIMGEIMYGKIPSGSCDYLAFDLLMRIGDFDAAFSILEGELNNPKVKIYQMDATRILKILVRMDFLLNNNNYEEYQLENILKKVLSSKTKIDPKVIIKGLYSDDTNPAYRVKKMFKRIINLIDEKRLDFLEKRIGGEIYEEDVKIIEKEIINLGLTKDLQRALKLIKNYNPTNEQEYAQHTGYLRSFLESTIKQLAIKVSLKKEESIKKIPKESEFVSNKSYLKDNDILDKGETRLLNAIYKILSSDGGSHLLSTPREKYRLLLNMSIEIIVLILSNFKKRIGEIKSENEKAREMLGGKTEWGGPTLYGKTPEENLEILKGYGGKIIEEMREKLKKEIEEKREEK